MQTTSEYYSKRTVSELRAMLTVAGIQTSTRTRKADLVTYVVNMLDLDHDSALMDVVSARKATIDAQRSIIEKANDSRDRRINAYENQNRRYDGKLTPAQRRRVVKKFRQACVKAANLYA